MSYPRSRCPNCGEDRRGVPLFKCKSCGVISCQGCSVENGHACPKCGSNEIVLSGEIKSN